MATRARGRLTVAGPAGILRAHVPARPTVVSSWHGTTMLPLTKKLAFSLRSSMGYCLLETRIGLNQSLVEL
jgi:hypothetical protein